MSDPTSTKTQFEVETLLARSILYQALSFFFRRPDPATCLSAKGGSMSIRKQSALWAEDRWRDDPTRDLSSLKDNSHLWRKAADMLSSSDSDRLRKLLDKFLMQLNSTSSEDWADEYEKLLGHTVNGIAPAYELEYGEQHTHREPQQLADIAAFYSAFGLKLSDRVHERADHASVELEFMYFLLYKEAAALEEGEEEKAQICRDASARFLSEHLGYWFPAFALRVSKHSEGFLKALADFAFEFVVQDCFSQNIKPGPQDLPIRAVQEKMDSGCVSCQFARPVS